MAHTLRALSFLFLSSLFSSSTSYSSSHRFFSHFIPMFVSHFDAVGMKPVNYVRIRVQRLRRTSLVHTTSWFFTFTVATIFFFSLPSSHCAHHSIAETHLKWDSVFVVCVRFIGRFSHFVSHQFECDCMSTHRIACATVRNQFGIVGYAKSFGLLSNESSELCIRIAIMEYCCSCRFSS